MRAGRRRPPARPRPFDRASRVPARHRVLARDLGRDRPAHGRPDPGPPHDAGVREHAPAGGARGGPAGRGAGCEPGDEPPWQPRPRAAARRRNPAQARRAERSGGDHIVGAGHRRGRCGPGDPGGAHGIDRHLAAARGPQRARAGTHAQGAHLPAHAGRPGHGGGAHGCGAARRAGPDTAAGPAARHPGPADRVRVRVRGVGRGAPTRRLPPRLAIPRPLARRLRRRGGAPHAGPGSAAPSRRRGRAAARYPPRSPHRADGRRRDPRHRTVPRGAGAGRHRGGFGGRGLRHRVQRRGHLPARQCLVADSARGAGHGPRRGRTGCSAHCAVLVRRGARSHPGALGFGGAGTRARPGPGVAEAGGGAPGRRGQTARRAPARGRAIPGRDPDAGAHRARALLRRVRRNAARPPRAFRRADQPGVGPGAAQAFLPRLRIRAAGGGQRGGDRPVTRTAAQLPVGGRVRLPAPGPGPRSARPGAARRSHVRNTLAVERDPGAAALAHRAGRPARPDAAAPDAGRGSAGAGVPSGLGLWRDPPARGPSGAVGAPPGAPDH
jgi:hypothetical protein